MKTAVEWDVIPCDLVEAHRRFVERSVSICQAIFKLLIDVCRSSKLKTVERRIEMKRIYFSNAFYVTFNNVFTLMKAISVNLLSVQILLGRVHTFNSIEIGYTEKCSELQITGTGEWH
jgi:hypothetical protein